MSIESSTLKFSGHQTFPVRYGWIYKIIQEVTSENSISNKDNIEKQMVSMGMGKNMVLSVRHWVRMLNLVKASELQHLDYELTDLARKLFVGVDGEEAFDKYIDRIGTVWLLHWMSQSPTLELTTARWFFNHFNDIRTDKLKLAKDIDFSLINHEKSVNEATLKKDIDCFFQTYSTKFSAKERLNEDSFTSPFTELGLIVQLDGKQYLAELSTRKSLPAEVFSYAVIEFFQLKQGLSNGKSISFDALLNDEGSPGRVFRLTSTGLSEKLDEIEKLTEGKIAWSDTQGLRQIQHYFEDITKVDPALFLEHYYQR